VPRAASSANDSETPRRAINVSMIVSSLSCNTGSSSSIAAAMRRKISMFESASPGGSSAPVLTGDDLDTPYDFDSMAKAGSMLGSGAIIVADESRRVLDTALKLAKFYAHESCGKCVPCREGTNWTHKMLQRIYTGEATPMDLDLMASVQEQIIGNCLCVLGDAMAMPIGSMVQKFRPELEAEIEAARAANDGAASDDVIALDVADELAGPVPVH